MDARSGAGQDGQEVSSLEPGADRRIDHTRDGGVTIRSSAPSITVGDQAPIRRSQQPTTSGQLASGAGATAAGATTIGLGGAQAIAAAVAINAITQKERVSLLVFGATSILLDPRSAGASPGASRCRVSAQTLLAGLLRLKTRCEGVVRRARDWAGRVAEEDRLRGIAVSPIGAGAGEDSRRGTEARVAAGAPRTNAM